jgi:hypothetical protein
MTTTFQLTDDLRTIEFEGDLIGEATNRMDQPRWTEVRIYRTDTGRFVSEVVGRSIVFHDAAARCASGRREQYAGLGEDLYQCDKCKPDFSDCEEVKVERDRITVRDWGTWEEMIEGLKIDGRQGRVLSGVTVRALALAREEVPTPIVKI